jgi:uncharacterized protein YyaL (SSP411 family)
MLRTKLRFQTLFHAACAVTACALLGCSPAPAKTGSAQTPPKHTNHLAKESSPYLLQHAHNPVDWYPWGNEAFQRAKKEDKPIFLSVGYAACHWCHVMERESFENEEIAKLLNDSFICIKVDREERPDVDDLYMTATQMMTGRGGWPMSVMLTPDAKPFYGATYFPPDDFKKLLSSVATAWKTRRKDVDKSADQITEALRRHTREASASSAMPSAGLEKALFSTLKEEYDAANGGFGKAPKFPPHNGLVFLFDLYRKNHDPQALRLALGSLDAMARGGIRDHLGGGFHRYSTDAVWKVPHFEKMLYDNALLARAYSDAYEITGKPVYAQVVRETLDWALREMRGPEGGFYSSLDADSEGEEGKFYLWSRKEIVDTLGVADGEMFCKAYNIEEGGNYLVQSTGQRDGKNILFLKDVAAAASLAPMRAKLLSIRDKRVRPNLDDKRLTAWNALMIGSLAHCGQVLKEPRYTEAAEKTTDFVLSRLRKDGRLLRRWRQGSETETGRDIPGFLEDYAYLADALLDLYAADGNKKWLTEADGLAQSMIAQFADPQDGFFDTPTGYDTLLVRTKNPYDQPMPAANAVAARSLLRLAALTEKHDYRVKAAGTLKAFGTMLTRDPRPSEALVSAVALYYQGDKSSASAEAALPSTAERGPVSLSATMEAGQAVVTVNIKKGWHINSNKPLDASLIPTRLEIIAPNGVTVGAPVYPAAKRIKLGFSPEPLSVYEGAVRITASLKSSAKGKGRPLTVRLRYQACDDKACLAPETLAVAIR